MWLRLGGVGYIYLAILFNSIIIEMYEDMFRISHGFSGCQMLAFMAVIKRRLNVYNGFQKAGEEKNEGRKGQ